MLHMIKHDPSVVQISSKLHLHDEAIPLPTPFIDILKMKTFLSYNLTWELTFLDVIIITLGLQINNVIYIATAYTMLESSNQVTNVG
jgi:hypothetical protein